MEVIDDFEDDIPPDNLPFKKKAAQDYTAIASVMQKRQVTPPTPQGAYGLWKSGPEPIKKPSPQEAGKLLWDMRKLRDCVNALIIKYYKFSDMREFPLAKQIAILESLALEYSSKELGNVPIPAESDKHRI